jgi:hypothetical protein
MTEEQGTVDTLQGAAQTPPEDTPLQKEGEAELTEEQKEELLIAEETKKITKPEDPPAVQKRINQAIRKWRTEERARVKAEKDKSETKSVADAMREHNRQLYEAMQKQTAATEKLIDVTVDSKEKDNFDTEVKTLNDRLSNLKSARTQAMKDMDADKVTFLEDQIDNVKEQLFEKKQEYKQKKSEPKKDKQQHNEPPAEIAVWEDGTEWYKAVVNGEPNANFNPAMAEAARQYDLYLCQQDKWQKTPIAERLMEVKKKIEEKFKYKKVEGKKPPFVEGGGLPPDTPSITSLTEEQKHVAHRMFDDKSPLEAEKIYAEQLGFIAKGRK